MYHISFNFSISKKYFPLVSPRIIELIAEIWINRAKRDKTESHKDRDINNENGGILNCIRSCGLNLPERTRDDNSYPRNIRIWFERVEYPQTPLHRDPREFASRVKIYHLRNTYFVFYSTIVFPATHSRLSFVPTITNPCCFVAFTTFFISLDFSLLFCREINSGNAFSRILNREFLGISNRISAIRMVCIKNKDIENWKTSFSKVITIGKLLIRRKFR